MKGFVCDSNPTFTSSMGFATLYNNKCKVYNSKIHIYTPISKWKRKYMKYWLPKIIFNWFMKNEKDTSSRKHNSYMNN